ncbi:hypothetical protein FF38_04440 [Lucilia cuprina]|uniref:Uncharacterized protein n=1 Tax=Lucilia cuprina TaxID=7375 RepID=A0A0L0C9E4_LUCCU|nr:hypothetical protein FF38_04440 [Lucilia cuprina]
MSIQASEIWPRQSRTIAEKMSNSPFFILVLTISAVIVERKTNAFGMVTKFTVASDNLAYLAAIFEDQENI